MKHGAGSSTNRTLPPEQLAEIRVYLQQQRALGLAAFKAVVEAKTRRLSSARPAHRPRLTTCGATGLRPWSRTFR
jgi:hypothetical protein